MAQARAQAIDGEAKRPKPRRRRILVFGAAGTVVVAVLAAGIGWYAAHADGPAPAEEKPARRAAPQYLPLDMFTVNVHGRGGDHFLQVGLTLQVVDAAAGELVKQHLPVIRNSLLLLLSGTDADQVKSVEGKSALQKDILRATRERLPGERADRGIEDVLFSHFVVQ